MKTTLLILLVVLLGANKTSAQCGTLDSTFGEDGMVSTEFGNYKSAAKSVAVQPDGKVVAAGATYNQGSYHRYALVRYNVDGTIDTSFGTEGKVIGTFSDLKMGFESVLVQTDGKIVASGIIYNNYVDSQFFIARFNTDGTTDESFGDAGMVIFDSININALAIQTDGKVIAAGFVYFVNSTNKDIVLIRFNTDGSLDDTFGTEGIAITSIGNRDYANAIAIEADGKIVVAGTTFNGTHSDFCILRYMTDGTPDESFGLAGVETVDTDETDEASSIKIQSDGKYVFSGWSGNASAEYTYSVMRMLPHGGIDTDFGDNGLITGAGASLAKSVDIQADGKILLAGAYEGGNGKNVALSRYNADGTPDATFGENGLITTMIASSCQANAVCLQADGKIVVGGEAGTTGGTYNPDFAVLRYHAEEQLGIGDNAVTNNFSVYPNPVSNVVNLQFNLVNSENLSVDLYDINGRKINNLIDRKDFSSGFNTTELQLPDSLSNGIYFLNITNSGTSTTVRIIK